MVDRARLAVTKWLPYSFMGGAISFVVGFVFHLQPPQIIVSASMTVILVFSALFFQSYGREKEQKSTQP